jgi:hypothetical protein
MIAIGPLIAVYVAFVVKHLLADYYLQTAWMVKGKGRESDWVMPLAVHAGVQAAGTLLIILAARPSLWWLAVVDFVLHFAIDRGKVLVGRRCGLTIDKSAFWWAIGTDQFLHQITNFAFVLIIVTG